jgi:hypothetical protein
VVFLKSVFAGLAALAGYVALLWYGPMLWLYWQMWRDGNGEAGFVFDVGPLLLLPGLLVFAAAFLVGMEKGIDASGAPVRRESWGEDMKRIGVGVFILGRQPDSRSAKLITRRGGGTGRRTGLKIL